MRTVAALRMAGLLAFLALPAAVLAQQQTGSLLFEVTDTAGAPVVGAKVAISSDKVPSRERVTDDFGKARFLLLPPGTFSATVTADNFNSRTEPGIDVPLGQSVTLKVELQAVLEESVEATMPAFATTPTAIDVDVTQTKTGTVMSSEQLQALQLGSGSRSYLSALAKTPGVASGGGNPSVHGATLGENIYTIDGVNTTDPVTGTFGLLTNFDIIEQLEVSTGGFQAQYGGATGGSVNQITKSGTNVFEGAFDIRYYDRGMVENSPHFEDHLPAKFQKWSGTLTGPVVKDKLWFALAYENNETARTPPGTSASRNFLGHANLAKLTWEPVSGHRVSFQYTEDPATITNSNAGATVDPTASSTQEQGARFYKLNYSGQLTDNWALTVQGGWYLSELNAFPKDDSGLPGVTNNDTTTSYQNYGNAQYSKRGNNQLAFQLQRSWSSKWGDHDFKFGYDDQQTKLDFNSYTPAGETWTTTNCPDDDPTTLEHEDACLDADADGDGYPDNVFLRVLDVPAGPTSNRGHQQSVYVQDTWRHASWTLDYGLRWDRSRAERDDKETVVDVALLQPRLGMAFDLKHDGRQKLSWSLSRRMHPGILTIPNAVNTHASASDYYYNENFYGDLNGNGTIDGFVFYTRYGGPSGSTVDKGLDAMFLDEFVLGYERKLKSKMRFATRLVLNETKDIIEDTAFPSGSGQYLIRNIGELSREYQGLEFEYAWLHRRGQFNAIATVAQAHGNVEYTQGLGSDWDILPDHSVRRWGYLSTDAHLRLRVFGWVDLPKKWQIAYDLNYRTGTPYNRTRPATALGEAGYGVIFLDPRGSARLPTFYTLDSEIRKTFDFGPTDRVKLALLGTILNVTNANAITSVRTTDPLGTPDAVGSPTRWGEPTAWQTTRTFEVGLRLTF